MSKKLVAYFSATGTTASAAKLLAEAVEAELYEIKPETPYTKADLNWLNPLSRSTKEMNSKKSRPAIIKDDVDVSGYDTVYLGFPIWWYIAPTIINSFLETQDFSGKKIVLFATSGGSGFGKAAAKLHPSCPDAVITEGMVFKGKPSKEDVENWVKTFGA